MAKTRAVSPIKLDAPGVEVWTSAHKLEALLAGLAFLADGMGTQALGLAIPFIIKDWGIPRAALASATASGLVGFAAGAAFGGFCGDRFGRRFTLFASLALLGLATAAAAMVNGTSALGIARVFAGLGLGASLPNAAAMIAEATPERHRSVALAIGLAFLPLGGFLEALTAALTVPELGWRGLFTLTGSIALLSSFAMAAVRPQAQPVSRSACGPPAQGVNPSIIQSLAGLLSADRRKDTIGLWFAFFFTVLIYYSVFSWLPAGLAGHGETLAATSRAMSAFSAGGLIGGLLAGLSIEHLGSRLTLRVLCGGSTLMAGVLAALFQEKHSQALMVVGAVGLLGAAVIALQTTLFALSAFLYTHERRSSGIGVAVGWGRIGAIVSSFAGVAALDRRGLPGFFSYIAIASAFAWVAVFGISRQIPRWNSHATRTSLE